MLDLTEQQEQEMIRRAKAGDPEANYQMSLWALEQAIAEPDEERWNRLAAKCLVKAVDAGYEPAKEKMRELLGEAEEPSAPQSAASSYEYEYDEPRPRKEPARRTEQPAEPEPAPSSSRVNLAGIGSAIGGAVAVAAAKVKGLFAKTGETKPAGTDAGSARPRHAGKGGFLNFAEWDDAKWKKMQRICVIVCVVLVLLIILLLITGKKRSKEAPDVMPTPVAEMVDTPAPSPTPVPTDYPDDTVKQEIAAADLDIFPADADYVTEATSRTVSTTSSPLNMRKSPDASGTWVSSIPSGTAVDVYAFKGSWALVKFGSTWGWCSVEYLK